MLNKIKCFLFGHIIDWKEYDKRIEKEEHYADGPMIFCERCRTYAKPGRGNK
jgi:hypothetical protein